MEMRDGMNRWERGWKRFFDIIFSLIGLIVLSPLILAIYLALRFKGVTSVFFRQERIGYKGKPFEIIKFRTMRPDAEKDGPRLAEEDDERIMPVSRYLRTHHLDELPQLWNVLKGDMSFVGPRPERRYFIDQIMKHDADYVYIYRMRPGLTSMATLYNGYTDTMEKMLQRLRMDLDYFRRRSFWLDVKIVLTTLCFIVNGKKF